MEHDRWSDNLSRLFDGELTGQEKADTEEHLKTCADCDIAWRLWSKTRLALLPMRQTNLGSGFRVKMMLALDKEEKIAPEPRLTWAPWLGLAATAALTVALSLPTPGTEIASADPTGLLAFASTGSLPSSPLPDWITEENQ